MKHSPDFDEFDFEGAHVKDEFCVSVRIPWKFQCYAYWALGKLGEGLPGLAVEMWICITVRGPRDDRFYALQALKKIEQELPDTAVHVCGGNEYAGQI